ncbi:myosin VIIA [Thecamonas trahens ATCC 50062]|uniref:Myosin VIIA n=1 Tax=Thecamonas trahens ATCC 50062 TaxID=461836 RepID=A0A0L0DBK1_THETB|nr:myosin VIIA [Thecamonas trahens ATCC 50062]KNC49719.1 myosin VIIA [Thecamonas trahens ATCC 50062]|eukprot:XP_013757510.1 myosin VIIA [Thecamonas trahens ATCC 50062]
MSALHQGQWAESGEVVVEPFWGELCDTCCELPEYAHPQARPKLVTVPRGGSVTVVAMSATNVAGRANMMELADLNVGELMHNLRIRYKASPMEYYTYVGDILIVVNPMRPTPLADVEHMHAYAGTAFKDPALRPHIFAIAERAYTQLLETSAPQAVIISGESGAGKTYSTRHVLDFLAFRSRKAAAAGAADATDADPAIPRGSDSLSNLGAASEILEALGNSKTLRNHNSSRFGKFVKIYFSHTTPGVIQGAFIQTYLLEKSRIVDQDDGERNYHIFYLMLEYLDSEIRSELGLGPVESYAYLIGSTGANASSWRVQPDAAATPMEDAERWDDLLAAIGALGLDDVFADVWRVCAAILHLGNIEFEAPDHDTSSSTLCTITNPELVSHVARLLCVDEEALTKTLLTCKVVSESRSYSVDKAKANVDALAKSLYAKMFDKVVSAINDALGGGSGGLDSSRSRAWIGVLDIFGFESFQDHPDVKGVATTANTFEQLCINLTNERLQRYFYDELIPKQLEHYAAEGIDVDAIQYDDNAMAVDVLMEGKFSVLSLLDDATRTATSLPKYRADPSLGDNLWVQLVSEAHAPSKDNLKLTKRATEHDFLGWFADQLDDRASSSFCVHHFAGTVWYSARGCIDKNSDKVATDCIELMATSGTEWLAACYDTGRASAERASVARGFARQLRELVCPPAWKSAANVSGGELDAAANPLFVRCVKPICRRQPGKTHGWLEDHKVLDQLQSAGMYAVIQMRQAGYPTELDKAEFLDVYWELEEDVKVLMDLRSEDDQIHHLARLIASDPGVVLGDLRGMPPYQVGKTKVFMKGSMASAMASALRAVQDSKLTRMEAAAKHLKSLIRMSLVSSRLPELRETAAARFEYLRRKRAFIAQGLTPEQADEAIRREDEEAAAREEERYVRKHYAPLQNKVDEAQVPQLLDALHASANEEASPYYAAEIRERAAKLARVANAVQATLDAFREDVHNEGAKASAAAAVHKLRKRVKKEEVALRADADRREAEARAAAEAAHRAERFEPVVAELADVGVEAAIQLLSEFETAFAPVVEAGKIDVNALHDRRARLVRNLARAKAVFEAWSADIFSRKLEKKAAAWVKRLRVLLRREDDAMEADLVVVAKYSKVSQVRVKLDAAREAKLAKLAARREELLAAEEAKARAAAARASAAVRAEARRKRETERAARKLTRQRTRFLRKLRASATALNEAGLRVLYQNMPCEIRYRGPITFNFAKRDPSYDVRNDEMYIGLETPVGKHSYNSGAISGVKYFKCYPQHGVFVEPSKLYSIDPLAERGKPLEVGDKVWHADSRFLRTGYVLFVGMTHFSDGATLVGVRLDQDEALGNTDGTVDGLRYFDVEFARGMFFRADECYRIAPWDDSEAETIIADYCALHDIDIESESGYMSDTEVEEKLFEAEQEPAYADVDDEPQSGIVPSPSDIYQLPGSSSAAVMSAMGSTTFPQSPSEFALGSVGSETFSVGALGGIGGLNGSIDDLVLEGLGSFNSSTDDIKLNAA